MKKVLTYIIILLIAGTFICLSAYMARIQKQYTVPSLYASRHTNLYDSVLHREDISLQRIHIHYEGDTAIIIGASSGSEFTVKTDKAHVTITANGIHPTEYTLSGTSENGSLKLYGHSSQTIILNGLKLTNKKDAAINVQSKAQTQLLLVPESTNILADASLRTDTLEESDACIFTEGNLQIRGTGELTVYGNYAHGIATDGTLKIASSTITIPYAMKDGLHSKYDFVMESGKIELPDFGHSTNDSTAKRSDGIQAKQDVCISGGIIHIRHYGIRGRGITANRQLNIYGGKIDIETTGDGIIRIKKKTGEEDASSAACLKSEGNIYISRGILNLTSRGTGGKCINADSTIILGIPHDENHNLNITLLTEGKQVSNNAGKAKAVKADKSIIIHSGTLIANTRKEGAEGMESKGNIYINNGIVHLDAYDDAINATGRIIVNGGTIKATSERNDAIDSNYPHYGAYTQTEGNIIALSFAGDPEEGIDTDMSPLAICGGNLISIGGSMGGHISEPNKYTAKQSVCHIGGYTIYKRNILQLSGSDTTLFSLAIPATIYNAHYLISSPAIKLGEEYMLTQTDITGNTETIVRYTQHSLIETIENHKVRPMLPPPHHRPMNDHTQPSNKRNIFAPFNIDNHYRHPIHDGGPTPPPPPPHTPFNGNPQTPHQIPPAPFNEKGPIHW